MGPAGVAPWNAVIYLRTLLAAVFLMAAQTVWACAPTVSATVLASDHVQVTAGAAGSCGGSSVSLYIDDVYVGQTNSDSSSVSGLFELTHCFGAGLHTATVHAVCNTNEAPNCAENGHVPAIATANFTIPHTTIAIDSADVDDDNQLHLVASYVIPTDTQTRSVTFYKNGVQLTGTEVSSQAGTEAIDVDLSCSPPDTIYQFGASALGCDYDYTEVPVTVHDKAVLKLNVVPDDSGPNSQAVMSYALKGTSHAVDRSLKIERLPLHKSGGTAVLLAELSNLEPTGTRSVAVTPTDEVQLLRGVASVCAVKADRVAVVMPDCCGGGPAGAGAGAGGHGGPPPRSVGKPVNLQTGNMRYSDRDPLADSGIAGLRRTYDSRNAETGLFGYGWSSLLDVWLRVYTTVDSSLVAVVGTEANDRVIFSNTTGAWQQIWPVEDNVRSSFTSDGSGNAVWTDRSSRRVWTFTSGTLTAVRSLIDSRQWTISRDGSGDPTVVADSWGSVTWTVTVDHTRHLVSSIGVQGRSDLTWSYQYNASNDLTAVLAPDNATWRSYSYSTHLMTAAHDPLGNLIESHDYGGNGNAVSSLAASDEITSLAFNAAGRVSHEQLTTVTWQSGRVGSYYTRALGGTRRVVEVHNGCSGCSGETAIYTYDDEGNVLRVQDGRGYIDESTYDIQNRLTLVTHHLRPLSCDPATSSSCVLTTDTLATATLTTTPATVSAQMVYGNPYWPDRPTQVMTTSVYGAGAFGRVDTFTYDATTGEVLVHTSMGNSSLPAASETHTVTTALYNGSEGAAFDVCGGTCAFTTAMQSLAQPSGHRKSLDGPRTDVSDVTQWVYYPNDASVSATFRGRLAATRTANGLITRYEDYDVFGNPRRMIDPNGVATESSYDALGRLLTSTVKAVSGCDTASDPLCATDLTTSRTYAAGGGPLATETRPLGGVTSYSYDDRGRLASVSRTVSATLSERMEYDYDPASGQKSAERARDNRTGSWVTRRGDSYLYDQQDRLVQLTHPDSTTVTYTYDPSGNVLTVKDENHAIPNTHYAYDPAGRLQSVTQTLTGAAGNAITTSYSYDLHGNLTSVTDPNGNLTSYLYDDFGRMLSQTSPVTGTTTYSYDPAGNLLATTTANGRTTTRTYDEVGRLTEADSTGGAEPETVTWEYDSHDAHFGLGRLTRMSDPSGATTYDYDRWGRLAREGSSDEEPVIGGPDPTTYAYDADGNLADLGYPSGAHVRYTSDRAGRPITVTREGTTLVSAVDYLPFGPLSRIVFGNGTIRESSYDQRYRMASNKLLTATGTLADYDYTSDDAGNITAIADALDATYSRTFGYDDLNRLTSATTGTSLWGTGAYTYDRMGNMQSFQLGTSRTGAFTYSGTTPKVATATEGAATSTVTYDAAGNELTGGSISTFTYSSRNLVQSDGTNSYTYDGRGVRVATTGPIPGTLPHIPSVTYSTYSHDLHLLGQRFEDFGHSGLLADFLWLGSLPIAQYDHSAATLHYTFTDHLGTPILQTDTNAAITWRAEYEPYGRIHTMRTGSPDAQPLRFPGQEDGDGAESYNIFRWYRAGWGRYTQADPLGFFGTANPYEYVGNNPVLYDDSFGLITSDQSAAVVELAMMWTYFQEMKNRNTIGVDKYYHCMAHCMATNIGPNGLLVSLIVGYGREIIDFPKNMLKKQPRTGKRLSIRDSWKDCQEDIDANSWGENAPANRTCHDHCLALAPKGFAP